MLVPFADVHGSVGSSITTRARRDDTRGCIRQLGSRKRHYGFVRSIKEECLDPVIPFGERHLRRTIAEYVEQYHRERNHQGIANALIAGTPATSTVGRIRRRPRLGGLLNYYDRAA